MFTKQYIKMCEKAKELRKRWKPKEKDFYFNTFHNEILCYPAGARSITKKEDIPLWSQEQLQEMVKAKEMCWQDSLIYSFTEWYDENYLGSNLFNSMNELWLAFVMWELYKKKWDGEKWVKEGV